MWGNNSVHARTESEEKEKGKPRCIRSRASYSWPDNWHSENPSLLFFLSWAECRAAPEVIVPIVSHKAGRNVWLALWETPLQGPHLSQPGDLNSATESSMVRSWQREICFLLKDGKLWEDLMWNQKWPLWYSVTRTRSWLLAFLHHTHYHYYSFPSLLLRHSSILPPPFLIPLLFLPSF